MQIKPLKLEGSFEIELKMIGDSRGYFMETYSEKVFAEFGIKNNWVQENQSLSAKLNTVRGLHFQVPPFSQTKLIRAVQGEILDVFVDLRKASATFGQWDSIKLSSENNKMALIPRGFAHGFCTLSESVIVHYKVDNPYSPDHEQGLKWNDEDINIDWGQINPYLSERDAKLPFFQEFNSPF